MKTDRQIKEKRKNEQIKKNWLFRWLKISAASRAGLSKKGWLEGEELGG